MRPDLSLPEHPGTELAARLEAQYSALPRLLEGTSAADLERRPRLGAWSAREHLAHLARYHEVFRERLERMRSESDPLFDRYRAEDDPGFLPWLGLSSDEVLRRLRALRTELCDAVGGLTDDDLARRGAHPLFGLMPVSRWIEFFLAHEGHHFYVLFQRAHERHG